MAAKLLVGVLARNPSTSVVERFGPDTADVPEWVRVQAPDPTYWVDDDTGEIGPSPTRKVVKSQSSTGRSEA